MKKFITSLLSITLLAGCLTACGGNEQAAPAGGTPSESGAEQTAENAADDYVLKIGYGGGLCEAPLHIAVENGYFDKVGLKYELERVDAAETASAVGSGKIDAGFGLLGKFLQPIDNGLPMRVTAGIHTGCTKVLVPGDSDVHSVADLKGKKIGVPGLGAAPAIIVKRSLAKNGIDISTASSEVEFSVFSMSDLPSALANGAVDVVAMSDPQGSVAEAEYGLRCIIDTAKDDDYKDEYCCISFVTDDIKTNHPEVAKNFTKAIMEASLWVQANPDETAKIQVEKNWVSGDAEFNASVLKQYNYKPSLKGGLEALEISAPALKEIGLIKETTDIDEFINTTFYELEGITDEEIYADSGVTEEELAASAEAKTDAAAVLSSAKLEELEDCCKEETPVEESEEKECCKHKKEQTEEHHEEQHEKHDCCKEEK
ncbi:MAG: ABC transporter substrate-binding protein [Firmicutes bacterium]|nr:ABC transporter substrate-binding protein [Bacillota bacterium]